MAKLNQKLTLILIAGAVVSLVGCASKPSAWSQQGSPWEARQTESFEQPVVEESQVVAEAPSDVSEPVAAESVVDLGEPGTPMEDPSAMEESPIAEPVIEEVPIEAEPEALVATETGDIASLPAGQFAVQVVASSSMENVMAFANANNISSDWIAKTMLDDKIWFVLLSGIYVSKAEANQALSEVSVQLDTAPWIRSVGSIQEIMAP